MKAFWMVLLLSVLPIMAMAQKRHLSKAWEYITKNQFNTARTEINEFIEKEPGQPLGHYALARWFYPKENPACNPDEAFNALKKSYECYEKGKTQKSVSSDPLFKQYADMLNGIRLFEDSVVTAAYEMYEKPNTVESFRQFQKRYPGYPQTALAFEKEEHLVFEAALAEKTIAALDSFLAGHPKAKDAVEARSRIEAMEFEKAKVPGKVAPLEKFMAKYPHSEWLDSAQKLIYEIAYESIRYTGSIADYKEYLSKYPFSPVKNQVLKKLWKAEFEAAKATGTVEALQQFMEEYPDAPEVTAAAALIEKINWEKAKASEDTREIEQFLSKFPNSGYLKEATALMISLKFRQATAAMDTGSLRQLMLQYPEAPEAGSVKGLMDSLLQKKPTMQSPAAPKTKTGTGKPAQSNTLAKTNTADGPPTATIVAMDMDMGVTNTELPGSTTPVLQTAIPAAFIPKPPPTSICWGPYSLSCTGNPVAAVPEFSPIFVSDEKDLLDYIVKSCLGSVGEAIDALTELMTDAAALQSKTAAAGTDINATNAAQKTKAAGKAAAESQKKLKASAEDAWKKSKTLYENMVKLSAGVELYAVQCMWDGIKEFTTDKLPEDLQKAKKATEDFEKAKKSLAKKMEDFQKLATGTNPADPVANYQLYADWKDIQTGIKTSAEGLGILYSYVNDPKKMLPYEMQMDYALENIEDKMGTLMTDCKIRECDLLLRDGIAAGQQALMAARKYYAQMRKGEYKWKEIIYGNLKHYKWMNLPASLGTSISGWDTWNKYRTEAYKAEIKKNALEAQLSKLGTYCTKLAPMAKTLNDRVNKYEQLYSKGLMALADCKLEDVTAIIEQLRSVENSDCGHFFPKPFDLAKSDALNDKLVKVKQEESCLVIPAGSYKLMSVEVTPTNQYLLRTADKILYKGHNEKDGMVYTFNLLSALPAYVTPGGRFTLYFEAECHEPNPNLDFFVTSWWKSNETLNHSYFGNATPQIMVGKREGKVIPSAKGSLIITVPTEGGTELYLKICIGFAFEGSIHEWLLVTYDRN